MSKGLLPKQKRGRPRTLTNRKFKSILEDIKLFGSTEGACAKHKVPKRTFYDAIEKYPEAREAYQMARDEANWRIEQEIARRGIEGVKQPVFHQGEIVGHITQYSDKMLELIAKSNMPDKYSAKNTLDVNVNHSVDDPKQKLMQLLQSEAIEGEYEEVSHLQDDDSE